MQIKSIDLLEKIRGPKARLAQRRSVFRASFATVLAAMVNAGWPSLPAAMAADQVLTHAGNGVWSNGNAWTPFGVPNNGALTYDAVFNGQYVGLGVDTLTLGFNPTIEKYTMTGGFLAGPDGGTPFTLTLNDALNWSGGIIGRGTVIAKAGGSIAVNSTCILGAATLDNRGTITYTATFDSTVDNQLPLRLDAGGVIVNRLGATFDIAGNGGISVTSATTHFDNQGLLVKSAGTGVSKIETAFNDTGTVRVDSGTLDFLGGASTHSGTLTASSGATLAFESGAHTFNPTASLGGQGTIQFGGDNVTFGGTLLGGAGALEVRIGLTQFVAGSDLTAFGKSVATGGRALRLIGQGTTTFNTGHTVELADLASNNNFTLTSNASIFLNGADDLSLTGPSNWTGGTVSAVQEGSVKSLTVNAPMTISGAGMALDHRRLQNNSTLTWTGGYIQAKNAAVIENTANATIDIQTDTRIEWGPTKTGAFLPSITNAGLIVKSAGTGEASFEDVRLTNTGTLRVQSGTLTFNHGATNAGFQGYTDTGVNSGTYQIDQGATLVVSDHVMDATSSVLGAGTMEFRSNNNSVAGIYNMTGRTNGYGGLAFLSGATVTNLGQLLNVNFNGGVTFDTGKPITIHDLVLNGTLGGSDPITITGKVSGAGTLASANIVAQGDVAPGNSPGILSVQGTFAMTSSADLNIELGGHLNESGITRFDVLTATGGITISGSLALTLVNDYTPAATDHMAIVTAGGQLSGLLDNVAPGSRLTTTDGIGSFIVNYGPGSVFGSNSVVVSNFQAVPEPAAAAILALLGTRALARHRRR